MRRDRSIIGKAVQRQYHSCDDRRRHARRLQMAVPERSLDADVAAVTRVSLPAPGAIRSWRTAGWPTA